MPNDGKFLCTIHDLVERPSRGFELENRDQLQPPSAGLLLVRKGQAVFGYLNSCPHTGVNLEWQKDDFLDAEQQFIQCSVHGALFRIEDGECLHGPCLGDSLTPVALCVQDGKVYLPVTHEHAPATD